MEHLKIITCPHKKNKVIAQHVKGQNDGVKDYLCLHNEDERLDKIEVDYFEKHNKRISEEDLLTEANKLILT